MFRRILRGTHTHNLQLKVVFRTFVPKQKYQKFSTQKEGMARLGLYKGEILLKPTINEVDFRLHVFLFHIPNLALISLLSPWGLIFPHWQMPNWECEIRNEE